MRLLADLILILHTGFIAFVILGLIAVWVGYFASWNWTRSIAFRVAHLVAIGYVVAQAWCRITCPLTTLENHLRQRAGQDPYAEGGFIQYWLHNLIFFDAEPWVFTLTYTLFGLLVVGTLIFAPPRRMRPPPTVAILPET